MVRDELKCTSSGDDPLLLSLGKSGLQYVLHGDVAANRDGRSSYPEAVVFNTNASRGGLLDVPISFAPEGRLPSHPPVPIGVDEFILVIAQVQVTSSKQCHDQNRIVGQPLLRQREAECAKLDVSVEPSLRYSEAQVDGVAVGSSIQKAAGSVQDRFLEVEHVVYPPFAPFPDGLRPL